MNVHQALNFVQEADREDLRALTKEDILFICSTLSPSERIQFLFAKNIKLFGGINEYIEDFFGKNTVDTILSLPEGLQKEESKQSLRTYLHTMSMYPGVKEEHLDRIHFALSRLAGTFAAPAAGGGKRKRKGKGKGIPNGTKKIRS